MERPTCRTCPFWDTNNSWTDARSGTVGGECRRYPRPWKSDEDSVSDEWPRTAEYDWCGEHPDFPAYLASGKAPAGDATPD